MSSSTLRPTAASSIPWALVLVLAGVALTRPLLNMTGLAQLWGKPATPLIATAAITGIWVMAMVLSRHPRPVQTLVLVGLTYAVLATALSAVASPVLDGELSGPLTNPFALVAMLAVNAAWGSVAGVLAAAFRAA